jgi:hypothetical protein
MSETLFTKIEAPDADGDDFEGALHLTREQYLTLERLTKLKALLAVNEVRVEQVTKWGHTDESDAQEPVYWHAKKAAERIHDSIDILRNAQHCIVDKRQRLQSARTKLLKGLALGLTAIDRIDALLDQLNMKGK